MSVAFTFGSFGDIVTVLQLAWQLRGALDGAIGAAVQIQALVADVDVFVNALQDIQRFVEMHRSTLRPDVMNGIGAALARCRDVLRFILQIIRRAAAPLSTPGWQRHWGSVAWSIHGSKNDVERLRKTLSDQVNVIQLYLGLSQAQNRDAIESQLNRHGTTLERICSAVQGIQMRFDVGVPSFLFCDNGTYYQPLARTSLKRLHAVWQELASFDVKHAVTQLSWNLHWGDYLERIQSKRPLDIRSMSCLFFKEAAFGQWQVLIGTRPLVSDFDLALKFFLERPHSLGETCNCEGNTARFRASHQASVKNREETERSVAEADDRYFRIMRQMEPEMDSSDMYLEHVVSEGPNSDFLRTVWVSQMENAQSLDDKSPLVHSATATALPSPPDEGKQLAHIVAKLRRKVSPQIFEQQTLA